MNTVDENFHRKHFLSESEHKKVNRYVQITAQYVNLFISDSDKVLDVGGSDGIMQDFLNGIVRSIDIFPASGRVVKGTIYSEPDEQYDVVVYNHVLEHIYDYYNELKQVYNKVKPGGYVFIACPHANSAWAYELDGHAVLFNEHILKRTLEYVGFSVVEYSTHCFREDKIEQWIVAQK